MLFFQLDLKGVTEMEKDKKNKSIIPFIDPSEILTKDLSKISSPVRKIIKESTANKCLPDKDIKMQHQYHMDSPSHSHYIDT